MWLRGDCEDGYESIKTGSSSGGPTGLVPGHESAWHSIPPGSGNSICGERRHSTVSDSGDTGIGTYYSDSMEDDSSSSTTPLSLQPLYQHNFSQDDGGIPIVKIMPAQSSSTNTTFRIPSPFSSKEQWSKSSLLLPQLSSNLGAPSYLDMENNQPIRRCSSLTKLSCVADKSSIKTLGYRYNPDSQGSLDRSVLYGYRKELSDSNFDHNLPPSLSLQCHSLLQRSPGAGPCYRHSQATRSSSFETCLSSSLLSPVKHNSLDMSFSTLPEAKLGQGGGQVFGLSFPKEAGSPLGHQTDRGSPIQPAVRTQMWLTEQMGYRPNAENGRELYQIGSTGTEGCGGKRSSPWRQGHHREPVLNQNLLASSLPVNSLVKAKEGLLRQREVEINRQKQQILQLHAQIRENELRAQHVLHSQRGWFDNSHIPNIKESRIPCSRPSEKLCCDEQLGKKLALAELEVLQLNESFKQVTQKYTEDIRKLEEKIKTRDRYISSLKKKCQRESEQSREKQQRIETLEKYLSDLPTLDEVQAQAQQVEVQQKAMDLDKTASKLQMSLKEGCALIQDKDTKLEIQAKRERELMASVHSLQQKVQQCLDDGVRLPMQDLRQLEVENTQLLEQRDHSSRLIEHQKEQIERLSLQITPLQVDERFFVLSLSHGEMTKVGWLLKEMSLCLLDLKSLYSILAQRAQGKEPNLSLLLGMKSLSISAEENERRGMVKEELRFKMLEVGQLRKDIDDLRKCISDCYDQYMGDGCVSQ